MHGGVVVGAAIDIGIVGGVVFGAAIGIGIDINQNIKVMSLRSNYSR